MKPLYWLRAWNFGDLLNPILYRQITGRDAVFSDVSPKILAIGSVLSIAKPGDIVWGSGCISSDTPLACDNTTDFCAIRGPLTANLLRRHGIDVADNIPFGEPSFLLPRFIKPSQDRNLTIGFLPHYIDYGQIKKPLPPDVKLLNSATDPIELMYQITSCRYIVSSSLHGLAVAEAYGIPAIWVQLADNIVGGDFKFRDYYLGSGRDPSIPLNWRGGYDWHEAELALSGWRPPEYDLSALMICCPFEE
jgi:pyruvyltransferase